MLTVRHYTNLCICSFNPIYIINPLISLRNIYTTIICFIGTQALDFLSNIQGPTTDIQQSWDLEERLTTKPVLQSKPLCLLPCLWIHHHKEAPAFLVCQPSPPEQEIPSLNRYSQKERKECPCESIFKYLVSLVRGALSKCCRYALAGLTLTCCRMGSYLDGESLSQMPCPGILCPRLSQRLLIQILYLLQLRLYSFQFCLSY